MHRQWLWAARSASHSRSWIIIIESRSGLLHYPDPNYYPIIIESRFVQIIELLLLLNPDLGLLFLFIKINSFLTGWPYTVVSRTLPNSCSSRLLVVNNISHKERIKIWRHHWLSALLFSFPPPLPSSSLLLDHFVPEMNCNRNVKSDTKRTRRGKKKKLGERKGHNSAAYGDEHEKSSPD